MPDKLPSVRMPLERGGKASREFATYLEKVKHDAVSSPSFVTVDLTGITDSNIPYMGTAGFADSPLSTDGTDLTSTGKVGIGTTAPDSIFHIKANVVGQVGSHPAGQLIIQDPDDTVFGNAVITGYESDAAGNPDQQLWYLGSSSSGNSNIIFLNRRNSILQLGTNNASHLTILGNGNVGIGVTNPDTELEVFNAGNQLKLSFDGTDNAVFAVDTAGVLTITPSGGAITTTGNFQTDGAVEIDGDLNHDGTNVGFYSKAPTAQAAHIADTAGDDAAVVNAILVVLENLGLVAAA